MALLRARFRPRLNLKETAPIYFRVWLTDIDASVMNHAAMLTVFECGRIDFMVRTGFFRVARRKKWFFPSSSIHVQFFRPMKLFQRGLLLTRILHVSDEFIYTEQKIQRAGKDMAVCIVKSKVKSGRDNVLTGEILHLLQAGEPPRAPEELIAFFEKPDEEFKKRWENNT